MRYNNLNMQHTMELCSHATYLRCMLTNHVACRNNYFAYRHKDRNMSRKNNCNKTENIRTMLAINFRNKITKLTIRFNQMILIYT